MKKCGKILATCLALTMLFTLTACGKSTNQNAVYIQSMNELTEEQFAKLLTDANDLINDWAAHVQNIDTIRHEPIENPEVKYLGMYFFTPKSKPFKYWPTTLFFTPAFNTQKHWPDSTYNACCFVYEIKMAELVNWNPLEKDIRTVYCTVSIKNMAMTSDDYFIYDSSMLSCGNATQMKENLYYRVVTKNQNQFNIVEQY